MRATTRLLAVISKSTPLVPGSPTGLTGLPTHAAPRSTLLYLYHQTLSKLQAGFPESSVYRQSTEALTKHRLSIIEAVKPEGLQAWQERVKKIVDAHPEAFRRVPVLTQAGGAGEENIIWRTAALQSLATASYEDEGLGAPQLEGLRHESERATQREVLERDPVEEHRIVPRIEPEPSLSAGQVEEVEQKMGAGLIEEVVQVAEGEMRLVDVLAEGKVWEDLEESPNAGQWAYFERDTHTPTTQKPKSS
ncbi:hypothetical protein LTR10_002803 [Elasticomyces elasticus]|nr:hypothetical protein LTR10_002803 [Elasticomyces elasticus]KAK4967857.1 hypothetical protein LTR42_010185 [Elasticomyces elasticus]